MENPPGNDRRADGQGAAQLASSSRLLLGGNPLPMWVYDVETLRILEVNEAAVAYYGYSREQFLAMAITDVRPGEDVQRLLTNVQRRTTEYQSTGPWRHQAADGRSFEVVVTSHLIDWEGRPSSLVTIEPLPRSADGSGPVAVAHGGREAPGAIRELAEALSGPRGQAVLLVGIGGIDDVVSSSGVAAGHALISQTEARLRARGGDDVAVIHMGGRRFCCVGPQGPKAAAELAQTLLAALREPFTVPAEGQVYLRCAAGIRMTAADETDANRVLGDALVALRRASERGGVIVFDPELEHQATRRFGQRQEVAKWLATGTLLAHYQPIVSLSSGKTTRCEALLRFGAGAEALGSPAEVVEVAEELGLISVLGERMLELALGDAAWWYAEGFPAAVAVNLSPRQLDDERVVPRFVAAFEAAGVDPERVCLELTESALVSVAEDYHAYERLVALRDAGARIAVDDFGTGYSSLSYLKSLPIHTVKIDRSFVSGLTDAVADRVLIEAIVRLAHALGLEVVAEGVERREELEALGTLGVDAVQGFLLAPPVPRDEVVRLRAFDLARLRAPRGARRG